MPLGGGEGFCVYIYYCVAECVVFACGESFAGCDFLYYFCGRCGRMYCFLAEI